MKRDSFRRLRILCHLAHSLAQHIKCFERDSAIRYFVYPALEQPEKRNVRLEILMWRQIDVAEKVQHSIIIENILSVIAVAVAEECFKTGS
jgi:hypothetical protein